MTSRVSAHISTKFPLKRTTSRDPVEQKRDWTLLYVLDGDNDLREAATRDLVELDQQGTPSNVNVVAQLFRGELEWNAQNLGEKIAQLFEPKPPSAVETDWRGMKVFQVRQENSQRPTEELSQGSSSPNDPRSLENFVAWGMKQYPANNYAVIISGHGNGTGVLPAASGGEMSINEAARALQKASERSGEQIDLLVLDSCSTEIASSISAFKDSAEFLVASPAKIGGRGWSEKATLQFLEEHSGADAESFGHSFLDSQHTAVKEAGLYRLADGNLVAQKNF